MTLLKSAAAAAVLAGAALSAHAADSDNPQREGEGPRAATFLSPAGEPFHAAPGQPYPVAVWFAQADANHDGHITREEFRADFERFFHVLDANGDGVIDGTEVDEYEHKIAPEILSMIERPDPEARPAAQSDGGGQGGGGGRRGGGGGGGMGGGGMGGGGGGRGGGMGGGQGGGGGGNGQGGGASAQTMRLIAQGAAAYSLLSIAEPVAGADMDLDGKITLAEFRAAADRRFQLLDTKQLGYLTLSGLPRTPEQIAIEGKKPKPPRDGPAKPQDG